MTHTLTTATTRAGQSLVTGINHHKEVVIP